jgi:4-hydroxy-L-threonine phosphate dehydrogenase PdxA
MRESVRTVALTIGHPNGIGPEIAVKAAAALLSNENIRVVLVGDEYVIRHYGERCARSARLQRFMGDLPCLNAIWVHPVESLACAATLKRLGVPNPRIGVFGINPQAGENGLFGDDDDRITAPAVART